MSISLKERKCPNIKDGEKCNLGYHLKGTKYSDENDVRRNDNIKVNDCDPSEENDDESINQNRNDFLEKLVEKKIMCALEKMFKTKKKQENRIWNRVLDSNL